MKITSGFYMPSCRSELRRGGLKNHYRLTITSWAHIPPKAPIYLTFLQIYVIIITERMKEMYICPICNKGFKTEESITKHSLQCWRAHNPNHESKPAPCECTTERQIDNNVLNFFASFRNK